MKIVVYLVRLFWWLGAAAVPFVVNGYYHSYRQAIQCPVSGDCYTPGSEHLLGIELLMAFSAFTIWPLFAWYVVIQPWRSHVERRRNAVEALPGAPRQ